MDYYDLILLKKHYLSIEAHHNTTNSGIVVSKLLTDELKRRASKNPIIKKGLADLNAGETIAIK